MARKFKKKKEKKMKNPPKKNRSDWVTRLFFSYIFMFFFVIFMIHFLRKQYIILSSLKFIEKKNRISRHEKIMKILWFVGGWNHKNESIKYEKYRTSISSQVKNFSWTMDWPRTVVLWWISIDCLNNWHCDWINSRMRTKSGMLPVK